VCQCQQWLNFNSLQGEVVELLLLIFHKNHQLFSPLGLSLSGITGLNTFHPDNHLKITIFPLPG
jgi:hypothetical protein